MRPYMLMEMNRLVILIRNPRETENRHSVAMSVLRESNFADVVYHSKVAKLKVDIIVTRVRCSLTFRFG